MTKPYAALCFRLKHSAADFNDNGVTNMRKINFYILLFAMSILLSTNVGAESVSLLKDLDVTNGFMIQYDQDPFFYTVELDEGESLPQVIAVPKSDDCTVHIDGDNKKVYPGMEQTVTVSVNDTKGNFETYTLKIYAKGKKGGLEFLRCLNGNMSPQFRDSARNFYIVLPNEYTAAELDIRTIDKKATVNIKGNENLVEGKRKRVIMTVTNSDGVTYEYALYIYREAKVSSNINRSFLLADIQINSGQIPIDFEQTKGYYRIAVPNDFKQISVKASAEERNNIVEISGTDIVSDSEHNVMTITVSNPDDESSEKSIYVLDFYHKAYLTTPVFSAFQTTMLIISGVFVTLFLCGVIYCFIRRKQVYDAQIQENLSPLSEKDFSERC